MSDCPIVRGLEGARVTVLMDGTTKIRPQLVDDTIGLIKRLRAELAAANARIKELEVSLDEVTRERDAYYWDER